MKPHFLIVGAMKAGTTTLYRDLARHPDVFLPGLKEPETLIRFSGEEAILDEYSLLYRNASQGQLCGDASTSYTKLPDYPGVVKKAMDYCGRDLKIIYMRREPISRIVSQYKHECEHGTIDMPFGEAVKKIPRLIDYSRYDCQIAPWVECFGVDNVMQLGLEEYSKSREDGLNDILSFLGLSPIEKSSIDLDSVANRAGEAKTIANPVLRLLVYSNFYQLRIKGLLSDRFRAKVRTLILPKPKQGQVELNKDVCDYILDELKKPLNLRKD